MIAPYNNINIGIFNLYKKRAVENISSLLPVFLLVFVDVYAIWE